MGQRKAMCLVGMLGFTALAACGCGPGLPPVTEVEGVVKLDGKPLAGVQVSFAPDAPEGGKRLPFSRAVTDAKGHYELQCEKQVPGALVGMHKVIVRRLRVRRGENDPPAPPPGPPIPLAYQSIEDTPLRIEVKSEQRVYDLNLKTPPS